MAKLKVYAEIQLPSGEIKKVEDMTEKERKMFSLYANSVPARVFGYKVKEAWKYVS